MPFRVMRHTKSILFQSWKLGVLQICLESNHDTPAKTYEADQVNDWACSLSTSVLGAPSLVGDSLLGKGTKIHPFAL